MEGPESHQTDVLRRGCVMAWRDHYHRQCKWCKQHIILGLCDDDVWRAYEYPPPRPRHWPVHDCPSRYQFPIDFDFFEL